MLNLESLKKELKKYQFHYDENVLPVHANGTNFLLGFTEKGIHMFPLRADWSIEETAVLPWQEVLEFKVKKSLLFENTVQIVTPKMPITMKMLKSTAENSWIKDSFKKLEHINYYQNMMFSFGGSSRAEEKASNNQKVHEKARMADQRQMRTETVEKIYQQLTQYTSKKMVEFELEEGDAGIFDCKIGGAYYVPEGEKVPANAKTGEALYLLAQVNFAQIPHLPDYPEKGLMQILISEEDMYGCDLDDGYNQTGWCIRYYEELPEQVDTVCIYKPAWHEDMALPMEKDTTYRLKPSEAVQTIPFDDMDFWPAADACLDSELRDCLEDDDILDGLCDMYEEYQCQLGGYPFFTQSDPRSGDSNEVLLFQLNSVKDIMWGDAGVANFFIDKEALKDRDFSHVMYNWDCY